MTDAPPLTLEGVRLGLASTTREEVIRQTGDLLVELGAVEPAYAEAMFEREEMTSSYIGEGVAIPHGTNDAKEFVHRATLVFLQYPDGIDWDGQLAHVAVGIAAARDEHMAVMTALARVLADKEAAQRLRTTDDPDDVLALLASRPS